MASFSYVALNESGREIRGTIHAESRGAAMTKLRNNGIIPVTVEDTSSLNRDISHELPQRKPKPRDMAVFCRQMVSILRAGVSVSMALSMLEDQTENRVLQQAIGGCRIQIESGSSLSEAMTDYRVFSKIFVTMVAAGESSGSLDTSFERMAKKFERDAKLRAQVQKATVYPVVVAVVAVVVIFAMMVFVVPRFEDILSKLGTELPLITRIVIGISGFFARYILLILVFVVIAGFGINYYRRTDKGRHFFGRLALKLPYFGKLTNKNNCALMSRTMATLLGAGVPMINALELTSGVVTNIYYKEALSDVRREVSSGVPLSDAFEHTGVFPALVRHMTRIGEETGDIVGMFENIADYFDEETEQSTSEVMAAVEPIIIVVLAVLVGVIVVSLIMPMTSMYSSLDRL